MSKKGESIACNKQAFVLFGCLVNTGWTVDLGVLVPDIVKSFKSMSSNTRDGQVIGI